MDELQTLQQLLSEFLSGLQDYLQSGQKLSSAFQSQASEYLNMLTSRIDELTQVQPTIPPLDKSMDSSVINAFKFDDKNGNLLVQFKGRWPNDEGNIYSYGGVPKEIFELFRRGAIPAKTDGRNLFGKWWRGKIPSMGSSMNVLLKGLGLPYQKLT